MYTAIYKPTPYPVQQKLNSLLRYPPCPQRQGLEFHGCGFDKCPKRHHSNNNTDDVHDIVAVSSNVATPASVAAAMLVSFKGA
jgi:hypothetical protein